MSITSRITDPFMYVEQYYVHIICAIFNEIVKRCKTNWKNQYFLPMGTIVNVETKCDVHCTDLGSIIGNTQCGNFRFFLPHRFYVKSILVILKPTKLTF